MVGTFSQITIGFAFLLIPLGPPAIRYTSYTFISFFFLFVCPCFQVLIGIKAGRGQAPGNLGTRVFFSARQTGILLFASAVKGRSHDRRSREKKPGKPLIQNGFIHCSR